MTLTRRVARLAAIAGLMVLSGCTAAQIARTAAGAALGGSGVAANVQAGKTNAQAISARVSDQRLVRPRARTIEQSAGETGVRAEAVQSVTVRNEAPAWVWLIAIAAVGAAGAALADDIRRRMARRGDNKGGGGC